MYLVKMQNIFLVLLRVTTTTTTIRKTLLSPWPLYWDYFIFCTRASLFSVVCIIGTKKNHLFLKIKVYLIWNVFFKQSSPSHLQILLLSQRSKVPWLRSLGQRQGKASLLGSPSSSNPQQGAPINLLFRMLMCSFHHPISRKNTEFSGPPGVL